MGGRAIGFFQQYGIQAVTGASGTVRHALEQYLGGQLRGAEPCRDSREHSHGEVSAEGEYERDEVGRLREEAEMLQQQLEEVMDRLGRLTAS
jgi:predicted Fe-Mo cluster-binding NifX family protein